MSCRRREGNNMRTSPAAPKSIDEYISGFPGDVQAILGRIRTTIKRAAPGAEEAIRYQMPTFVLKGNLISFAAYKKHIGLYPAPTGSRQFNKELAVYRAAKSTVRVPLDGPIPFALITQIVKIRVRENLRKAEARAKKKVGQKVGINGGFPHPASPHTPALTLPRCPDPPYNSLKPTRPAQQGEG